MQSKLFKRKWVIILCLIAMAIASCALAACTYEPYDPLEDGYTATVIYDANGGRYSDENTATVRTFRYKPGTTIMEPGVSASFASPTISGKHISGWYIASLDSNSQPLKNTAGEYVDESGNSIFDGTAWNFSEPLPQTSGTYIYLVAHWSLNFTFTVDVGEEAHKDNIDDYIDRDYNQAGPVNKPVTELIRWPGHTLHYIYTINADGTHERLDTDEEWASLILSDENPNITVYASWLEGEWQVVTSADQLSYIESDENYFIDCDIDMGGKQIRLEDFNGEFNGNGHVISNVTFSETINATSAQNVSMFSFDSGYMHDVTFENISYTLTISLRFEGHYNIGLLGADASSLDLTKFTDINFIDCSITIYQMGTPAILTYGEGDYLGIFGRLGEGQVFIPGENSRPVTVTV